MWVLADLDHESTLRVDLRVDATSDTSKWVTVGTIQSSAGLTRCGLNMSALLRRNRTSATGSGMQGSVQLRFEATGGMTLFAFGFE